MGFWGSSRNDKSYRALSEHFDNTCGACSRLNPSTERCSYVSFRHKLNEPAGRYRCNKYDGPVDPERRDYAELYYQMTGRRYYFILTVICEVLGIDKNHEFYQEIKTLIQLVRQDSTTEKEAVGYDTFGPEIADNLLRDPNVIELCKSLLTNYLTRAFILIKENKQEEAIQVYKDMVTFLFIRYRNVENYSNLISGESFENPKVLIRK